MSNWNKIKEQISSLNSKQQLSIIAELYKLSEQNKNFIHARFLRNESGILEKYKQVIKKYMYPNIPNIQDISLSKAKKAITDYRKATKDLFGTIDLMIYYIECGHKFIKSCSEINERFHDSLISMFEKIIELLQQYSDLKKVFYSRLKYIADELPNLGRRYYRVHNDFYNFFKGEEAYN